MYSGDDAARLLARLREGITLSGTPHRDIPTFLIHHGCPETAKHCAAVGCHTTLKAHASVLDTVVFVADKIAWDQPGIPPYRDELLATLAHSLDAAALVYLRYLWKRCATLGVIHPWFVDAHRERADSGC